MAGPYPFEPGPMGGAYTLSPSAPAGMLNGGGGFIDRNRMTLAQLGANLMSPSGFTNMGANLPQAMMLDRSTRQQTKQQNATIAWLKSQGIPDDQLAMIAQDPSLAGQMFMAQIKAKTGSGTKFSNTPLWAKNEATGDVIALQPNSAGGAPSQVQTPPGYQLMPPGAEKAASDATAVDDIVEGIKDGSQPPTTQGLYHNAAGVRAKLAKDGFDLAKAQQEWTATQKFLASANNSQQLRLHQAINQVDETLPLVEELGKAWNAGKYRDLNILQLDMAKRGLLDPEAQSVAVRLDAAIGDVTAEAANIFMGGNSPTDKAIDLAMTQLDKATSVQTLMDSVAQLKKLIQYRKNSLNQAGPVGTPDNRYAPQQQQPAPAASPLPPPAASQPIFTSPSGVKVFSE